MIAGKDHEAGGSWMGGDAAGRSAAVTDYRELERGAPDSRSRGDLIASDCRSVATGARGYFARASRVYALAGRRVRSRLCRQRAQDTHRHDVHRFGAISFIKLVDNETAKKPDYVKTYIKSLLLPLVADDGFSLYRTRDILRTNAHFIDVINFQLNQYGNKSFQTIMKRWIENAHGG